MILPTLAVLSSLAYSGATVYAVLSKSKLDVLYTYHPLAASAFFVFAITGVVTAQAAQKGKHKARITTHGFWQVAATLTALATNAIIYMVKEEKGKPHLASWHGRFGAATTGCWIMLQTSGGLAWYLPSLASKVSPLAQMYVQHGLFGMVAFALLITTHGLALAGGYQGYKKGTNEWYALAGLLGVSALGVWAGAGRLLSRAKRILGGGGGASASASRAKAE